jgi:Leucine-rich repeat (LRR) protein
LNERGWLTFDDECDWYGITCNANGLVEEIDLSNNILTGLFPPETQLLKNSLKVLDIYSNYVFNVGDAGNSFLGELTLLEELYYGTTSFQYDGIPTYIAKLTNLYEYDCSYALYFGELKPEIFENLNKLEYLYIGGNSFNSAIPTNIGSLPNLLYFYAEYADIVGDLSFMKGMANIYELWVDRNPLLTGPLFSEIGELVTLESFSVTRCGLEGKIPSEIGQLTSMQQMWLYNNRLTGAVPSEMGAMTDMNRLELEVNELTGTMPTEVCSRVDPLGKLAVLESDCDPDALEIQCTCCTCCGEACAEDQQQGNAGNAGNRARQRKQR